MSFQIHYTDIAAVTFKELEKSAKSAFENRQKTGKSKSSKPEGLFKQVRKTIILLSDNPRHLSLNTHEYSNIINPFNSEEKVFEACAQNRTPGTYRVFWCYGPDQKDITIITITPHP